MLVNTFKMNLPPKTVLKVILYSLCCILIYCKSDEAQQNKAEEIVFIKAPFFHSKMISTGVSRCLINTNFSKTLQTQWAHNSPTNVTMVAQDLHLKSTVNNYRLLHPLRGELQLRGTKRFLKTEHLDIKVKSAAVLKSSACLSSILALTLPTKKLILAVSKCLFLLKSSKSKGYMQSNDSLTAHTMFYAT